mmetsp:Transcript_42994/g.100911  ORF Transcript_42994/g.100911 Transcript_42994/m.100911 type:complete len:89 (+) Transcript_42994:1122-1388(+)
MIGMSDIVIGNEKQKYLPILWGYFRALRFAGDLTDWGVDEIQIEHFELNDEDETRPISRHVEKQKIFQEKANFEDPFDVGVYQELLTA